MPKVDNIGVTLRFQVLVDVYPFPLSGCSPRSGAVRGSTPLALTQVSHLGDRYIYITHYNNQVNRYSSYESRRYYYLGS